MNETLKSDMPDLRLNNGLCRRDTWRDPQQDRLKFAMSEDVASERMNKKRLSQLRSVAYHLRSQRFAKVIRVGIASLCGLFMAHAAMAQTVLYSKNTAGQWTYTVPAGVTGVIVSATGGGGGGGGADWAGLAVGGVGGNGARVSTVLSVTPGQVLSGTVGGGGQAGWTWDGGNATTGGTGWRAGGPGGASGGPFNSVVNGMEMNTSGSGGGGGGSTLVSTNGMTIQAGGGGGGGGGAANSNGGIGIGGSVAAITSLSSFAGCDGGSAGNPGKSIAARDGGGGGGGGGGFVGGSGGDFRPDNSSITTGGGGVGSSCYYSTLPAQIITPPALNPSTGPSGLGGKGGQGPANSKGNGVNGTDGSVVITSVNIYPPSATIALTKVIAGGGRILNSDQFTLAISSGGVVTNSSTTYGGGSAVGGGNISVNASPGSTYTLTEAMAPGSSSSLASGNSSSKSTYMGTISCQDSNALQVGLPVNQPLPLSGIDITPVAGANISCTITNKSAIVGSVQLRKVLIPYPGASGNNIGGFIGNLIVKNASGTQTSSTPVSVPLGSTDSGWILGTVPIVGDIVISETSSTGDLWMGNSYPGAAAWGGMVTCVDDSGLSTELPTNQRLPAAFTSSVQAVLRCTVTNSNVSNTSILLTKALGGSGRKAMTDQFVVSVKTGGVNGNVVSGMINNNGSWNTNSAIGTTAGAGTTVTGGTTNRVGLIPGTTYTLTEAMAAGSASSLADYTSTISCTDRTGLQQGLPTNQAYSPSSGLNITPVVGALIECTITNIPTGAPSILFEKALNNARVSNTDQFTVAIKTGGVSGTVVNSTANSTTTGSGSVVDSNSGTSGVVTASAGTTYTLTEAMASGSTSSLAAYSGTVTCTDFNGLQTTGLPSGAPYSPASGVTITPMANTWIYCSITNTANPTITLTKALAGSGRVSNSDQFTMAIRTGGVGGTVMNSTSNSTTTGSGATVNAGTGTTSSVMVNVGTTYTLTEAMAPGSTSSIGLYTGTISCTDNNGVQAGLPYNVPYSPSSGFAVTPVAGANISCVITNAPVSPTITLKKALGGTGRLASSDQFTVAIRTGGVSGTVVNGTGSSTTAGSGTTVNSGSGTTGSFTASAGTTYTLTEAMASGSASSSAMYSGTISCTDSNGAQTGLPNNVAYSPSSGFAITPVGGASISCTITNAPVLQPTITGKVFLDTGVGGGTANDGILNGAEQILAGVTMTLSDCAGTVYGTTVTDAQGVYNLAVPSSVATNTNLCIQKTNPGGMISTWVSFGPPINVAFPSSGVHVNGYFNSYATATDTITVGWNGTGSNFNWGVVPNNTFVANGAKSGVPDSTVSYAHTFTAGTVGTVVFTVPSATSTPTLAGWSEKIFADPTCSGTLQAGAAQLFPPAGGGQSLVAGQAVCIVVQEFIPGTAQNGNKNDATVQAAFTATNQRWAGLSANYTLDDVTTVGGSALSLLKEVRDVTTGDAFGVNNQAKSGDVLEYRITYTNNAPAAITNLVINDTTPAFTTFVSGTTGTTPATLTACVKNTPANPAPAAAVACTAAQAAGGTGSVSWKFTGGLPAGSTGQVLFQVKVD
ncbi:DUF11 domain-containing protein [Burkholderia sp. BCC0405]|uniref:beta strand repeat-containing protein n=1 Tax=Burkholderia sp. BCC0405 TaxID=2676298 RepID=UPI0015887489|nr:DUF11 domain-containing protein [Burkholderia sp. BCC0405]